ncbi:hypothetical protein KAT80_03785 [Candidatus Pacearchaeota archaeon]|nr:hypothetical protein [Candidatus Pacearchaeota archaeon]
MKFESKRGQIGVTQIILGLLIAFLAIIGVVAIIDITQEGGNVGDAIMNSFNEVSTFFMTVLGPTFGFLLNLGNDDNTNFLIVLTFILISIIVVGTLDSVNIFGEDKQGGLVNLAIGIIVSIIGVRFMPPDIWMSLTAPSSAFVATILVGAPFAALFFVTMKLKFNLAGKLLWLFYIIFMSYLIFFPVSVTGGSRQNDFMWIYIVFLVLAGIMMFFDSTVRRYWYKEKYKSEVEKQLGTLGIKQRAKLRGEISDWQDIIGDSTASPGDRKQAKKELDKVKAMYGDVSSI